MNKSNISISLILSLLLWATCMADLASQYGLAERYMMQGNTSQGIALFNQIATENPDSDYAKRSVRQIIKYHISFNDGAGLESAIEQVAKDYIVSSFMADLLDTMAGELQYKADYGKAKVLFKQIVKWYPESDYYQKVLLDVKKVDILSFIHFNDPNKAQQLCDQMFVENSGNPYMPQALRHILQTYEKNDQDSYAETLGQLLIGTYPESVDAATVQAAGYTSSGDYQAAKTLYIRIMNQFPGTVNSNKAAKGLADITDIQDPAKVVGTISDLADSEDLPKFIFYTAQRMDQSSMDSDANTLYETLVNDHPQSYTAVEAAVNLILQHQQNGNTTTINNIISDLKTNHENLGEKISQIAESDYKKSKQTYDITLHNQRINKAIKIWKIIILYLPGDKELPHVYCYLAESNGKINNYEKSLYYWQKVAAEHSDFRHHWYALYNVGRTYQILSETGKIEQADADSGTIAAYEELLEKYPNCSVADTVRVELDAYSK